MKCGQKHYFLRYPITLFILIISGIPGDNFFIFARHFGCQRSVLLQTLKTLFLHVSNHVIIIIINYYKISF